MAIDVSDMGFVTTHTTAPSQAGTEPLPDALWGTIGMSVGQCSRGYFQ